MSGVAVFSLNFRNSSLEERARIRVGTEDIQTLILESLQIEGIRGAVPLETCNRIEYFVSYADSTALKALEALLLRFHQGAEFSRLVGHDSIRHLFSLVSGLDSMVIGEAQIAGQVKAAYHNSLELGHTDRALNRLFNRAFFVSKRVRSSTQIGVGSVSVASIGIRLAEQIVGDLSNAKIVLIGAGEMGRLALSYLSTRKVKDVLVFNRTFKRAWDLANGFAFSARNFSELPGALQEADLIISAVSGGILLNLGEFNSAGYGSGKCILDLSFPRSVAPEVGNIDGVYLYGIDDLRGVSEQNRSEREQGRSAGEQIVESEVDRYVGESVHDELGVLSSWMEEELSRVELLFRRELLKSGAFNAEALQAVLEAFQPAIRSAAARLLHPQRLEIRLKGQGAHNTGRPKSEK